MPKNYLENVWKRYIKAGEILHYPDRLMYELTSFKMRLSFDLHATVAGKSKRLKAVRIWHRSPLTDCLRKGGNRYHAGVTMGALEGLAAEMSPKCWIHEIPYGGAKGGVDVDPNQCTPQELEQITYTFVDELDERNAIGPFTDVGAPDVGTNSLIMFWMAERYKYRHRGEPYVRGVVTGKPVKVQNSYVGGIIGRVEATGYGLHLVLDELRKSKYSLLSLSEIPSIAIIGFGNVGRSVASYAEIFGYKVIAVTDELGGVFCGDGLNIPHLINHANTQNPKTVKGFPKAENISTEELLKLDCDILIPAALEEMINHENAAKIMAKIIVEGGNGPITPEAEDILTPRCIIIPDILVNSGGLVVSFFEWAHNVNWFDPRLPHRNELKSVFKALEIMMRKATAETFERSIKYSVSLRDAAFMLALEKAELLHARRIPEYAAKIFQ